MAEAKQKAKDKDEDKAKATKKGKTEEDDDDYKDDEDEDPYSALSKMWKNDLPKPPVGGFENCARCEKQFTVVCLSVSGAYVASVFIIRMYRPNTRWPRTLPRGGCAIYAQSPLALTHSRNLHHPGRENPLGTSATS